MSEDQSTDVDGIDIPEGAAQEAVDEQEEQFDAKPVKEKKVKVKKPAFGNVDNTDETIYPFSEEVPEGYEFGKFAPLKKRDFKEEHIYTLHRAADFEHRALKMREEAEKIKALGGTKARSKAKRLIKLREQFTALSEQLKLSGIDVDVLLSDD